MKKILALIAALFVATPALAQWQVPEHQIPVGRGQGSGFKSILPGTSGQVLTSNGSSADPTFEDLAATGGGLKVNIEDAAYGGSCASSDNTAALLAAVASVSGPVVVYFPSNCTYTFTQANAITFTKTVYVEGAATNATRLNFVPTSNGIFLHWLPGVTYFQRAEGGVRNISLISTDSTYTKTMVQPEAITQFRWDNVSCGPDANGNSVITGGTGSICFYPHGWDFGNIGPGWMAADQPAKIGLNPYNSTFSQDHWHWHDLYFQHANGVGNFPSITVDPGVLLTNVKFDGISCTGGTYCFLHDDPAAFTGVSSVAAGGSGYVLGEVITLTGGTCSTPLKVRVTKVTAGAIDIASLSDPGVCSVKPSNPVSQASTTGSGTGATFNLISGFSFGLSFDGMRSEQGDGTPSSNYSIYISPQNAIYNLSIKNSVLDSSRQSIFLKNTKFATIENNSRLFDVGSARYGVNATSANGNDMVQGFNNFWAPNTVMSVAGMTAIYTTPSPTGSSSSAPPSFLYSSTISSATYGSLVVANSLTLPSSITGVVPFANGGTNDSGTAWTTYTPTVTATGGGTFTTISTSGRYKRLTAKTYALQLTLQITDKGTATGAPRISLPATAGAGNYAIVGRESSSTGVMITCTIGPSATTADCFKYDNTTLLVNGYDMNWTGIYEAN